ncbi:MAG: DMT family transporter [Pirellulaceae bacterium]|nr:DMT family transporter [Pirellulaceae bacterium]
MKFSDAIRMLTLAAIWGASFPLMRQSVGEFGTTPIAAIRVVGGCCFLCPVLMLIRAGDLRQICQSWRPIAGVGLFNSALPFLFYSYASSTISAGLASVFNATTPLWGAMIARLWLGDRLRRSQLAGLILGFAGVVYLAWDSASLKEGSHLYQIMWAISACLGATFCYGLAGNLTKVYLVGVAPLATATGSLFLASLLLVPPALVTWPAVQPSMASWQSVLMLAVGCTGIAYVIFYRLLASSGPTNAMAVAYLIPLFANLWGWLFLGESPKQAIVIGCSLILLGTSLTTGILKFGKPLNFARASTASHRPLDQSSSANNKFGND